MEQEKKHLVAGIGEILWDIFPEGKQLGSVTTNFAFHARQLGAECNIVSSVGKDNLGNEIFDYLKDLGLDTDFIDISNDKETGIVNIRLNKGIPNYKIKMDVAWDFINWNPVLGELAKSLELATVLKLNDEELPVVAELFSIKGSETIILEKLMDIFDLKLVALTMGSQGSILKSRVEKSFLKVPKVKVKNTVGAGDSFMAGMAIAYLNGKIHHAANEVGAFICSKNGTTPILPEKLARLVT